MSNDTQNDEDEVETVRGAPPREAEPAKEENKDKDKNKDKKKKKK